MKKISIFTLSIAAVMLASTAMPMSSLAGLSTYQVSYPAKNVLVVSPGGQNCIPGSGIQGGGWGQSSGWNPGGNYGQNSGWGAGPVLPDNSLPEITPPGFIFPTPELPGPELPDRPGDTLPDNPGEAPEIPDRPFPDKPDQDTYAQAVVELVNAERKKAGLTPLSINEGVAEAAQVRAQEIRDSFSHTRPDGSSFNTVLTQTGVSFRGAGENIAYGQNSPEAVMQGWMNSSGHRANILNRDYTAMGVGHFQDSQGTHYWTQIFIY